MEIIGPAVVLIICLSVLILSGQLIGFALGVTGLILIFAFVVPTKIAVNSLNILFASFNSYVLMAVPMFIFIGEIILHSGLGDDLYTGVSRWLSRLPGGLIQTNIVSCSIFAAISGSSVATAATIGTVAYPEQTRRGYRSGMILGSLAGAGTLGLLIPPSITLLIYGAMVGESIGQLFMGGVVPGVMLTIMFMSYIAIRCKLNPHLTPREEAVSWKAKLMSLTLIWPAVFVILMVLGGIYLGVMTPTEAAGVGAILALVAAGMKLRLNWRVVRYSVISATKTSCMVMFIVAGALVLQFGLTCTGLPRQVANTLLSLPVHPIVIMMGLYLMYLAMGCLFEGLSMMLLTLPIVYPVIMAMGFDSVWFGVILTLLIEEAQITPPVGLNLFVLHGITKEPMSKISRSALPYFLIILAGILICTAFPRIILWLPGTMFQPMN